MKLSVEEGVGDILNSILLIQIKLRFIICKYSQPNYEIHLTDGSII